MDSDQQHHLLLARHLVGAGIAIALILFTFVISPSLFTVSSAGSWFVAPAGNDSNTCQDPEHPCATINAAIGKASPGDTVKVALGTYAPSWSVPGDEVVLVNKALTLQGGWDSAFTGQAGLSTIDGDLARRGITVNAGVFAWIEGFAVQNGYNGGIRNSGTLTMTDVTVSQSQYQGISNTGTLSITESVITDNYWDGIANSGTLFVSDSTISDNRACTGCGGGISSYGTALIQNTTISGNQGWGIKSTSSNPVTLLNSTVDHNGGYGVDIYSGNVIVVNSTVSGNTAGGFFVENNGSLSLYSSTVSYNGNLNPTSAGGGIRIGSGTVHFANTILANNIAPAGPDCYKGSGGFISDGYNLIGNTLQCSYTPGTGDLTNISPGLTLLQDYGGPTRTHGLFASSPAINAGDPQGCLDHQDNPLTTDQRGFPRFERCDLGAYERQPGSGPSQAFLPCLSVPCYRLYYDDFSDPGSGWPYGEDPSHRFLLEYLNNEYRILVKISEFIVGALPGFAASDFSAAVDVRNETGVAGSYGILFGFSGDGTEFYLFAITPDSFYVILKYQQGSSPWTVLAQGESASILPGTATNQLKVKRSGGDISVYANGQLLTSIIDNSYLGSRYIGLTAESFTQPDLDVRFDNFTVVPPNCPLSAAPFSAGNTAHLSGSGFVFGKSIVIKQK